MRTRRRRQHSHRALGVAVAATLGMGVMAAALDLHHHPLLPRDPGPITVGEAEYLRPMGGAKQPSNLPGNNLRYGGGGTGAAVITQPAVYLVFWGRQWSHNDPLATYLQRFVRGLYGRGDDWTRVASQYCEGGSLARGDQRCPANATFIGRPSGSLLAGVWFDDQDNATPMSTSALSPADAVQRLSDGIAYEATKAAAHFNNIGLASNNNAIYLVMTPWGFSRSDHGTYCAYHSTALSSYGSIAYAHLPYVTRWGSACGMNLVNKDEVGGHFDGVSIVAGHEFMEMLTNPRPATGWVDNSGGENGDKCSWIQHGRGAMDNLYLTTGRFAVQSTWSNAINYCTVRGGG